MSLRIRPYVSPTLVLLAIDWPEGKDQKDFLGFAIKRSPGFRPEEGGPANAFDWLPNRVTFNGPVADGKPDAPSKDAPIQKFMWWDARIEQQDRGASFTYDVYPVLGTPDNLSVANGMRQSVKVKLPQHIEDGVGTWFNRAVLSSQAFTRKLKAMGLTASSTPSAQQALELRTWLANDLQLTFNEATRHATKAVSAVYHLTDDLWAIPAFEALAGSNEHTVAAVYDSHLVKKKDGSTKPSPNQKALEGLPHVDFYPRDKTSIMHNKFIVSDGKSGNGRPQYVLAGSANFTTEGITQQANLLHIWDSPEVARIYNERSYQLAFNPSKSETAALADQLWSDTIQVGSAKVRVCFSPEPGKKRQQIDTVVAAIKKAKKSVLFCIFTPTDKELRKACFDAGDKGLMMFGLVNALDKNAQAKAEKAQAQGKTVGSDVLAGIELYHRSSDNKDVVDGKYFSPATVPDGFETELRLFPGDQAPNYAPVVIHHKFIIIDAETDDAVVYSGSANMSQNSEHNNDENLLEIRSPRIAQIYLAEFMRLYEHYRARAIAIQDKKKALAGKPASKRKLMLCPDASWSAKYYKPGTPEAKAREAMASPLLGAQQVAKVA